MWEWALQTPRYALRARRLGRAGGPVRVVRGPQDFDQFDAGEVLVAQATAPVGTPLFGRTVAVVKNGGSLAAHASLVAREYGIPAVVVIDNCHHTGKTPGRAQSTPAC